jgi:hypothetical protein
MRSTAVVRSAAGKMAPTAEMRTTAAAEVATATRVRTTATLCEKGSRESRGRQNKRYGDQTGHRLKSSTILPRRSWKISGPSHRLPAAFSAATALESRQLNLSLFAPEQLSWQVFSQEESMKNFLAGLGLGFGLGVLFAPMRGEDVREMIAVRASELGDQARDTYQQVRDRAEGTIAAVTGQATGTEGR